MAPTPITRPPQILTCREKDYFYRLDTARRFHQRLAFRLGWIENWDTLDPHIQGAYAEAIFAVVEVVHGHRENS